MKVQRQCVTTVAVQHMAIAPFTCCIALFALQVKQHQLMQLHSTAGSWVAIALQVRT